MAVILKIDKPKSCADCILTYAKRCPLTNNLVLKEIINDTLSEDCPLESADEYVLRGGEEWEMHYKNAFNDGFVEASKQDERMMKNKTDEMIAEIHELEDINPDYPMDRRVHLSKWEVLDIIHKYTKEQNNGNSKDDDRVAKRNIQHD